MSFDHDKPRTENMQNNNDERRANDAEFPSRPTNAKHVNINVGAVPDGSSIHGGEFQMSVPTVNPGMGPVGKISEEEVVFDDSHGLSDLKLSFDDGSCEGTHVLESTGDVEASIGSTPRRESEESNFR